MWICRAISFLRSAWRIFHGGALQALYLSTIKICCVRLALRDRSAFSWSLLFFIWIKVSSSLVKHLQYGFKPQREIWKCPLKYHMKLVHCYLMPHTDLWWSNYSNTPRILATGYAFTQRPRVVKTYSIRAQTYSIKIIKLKTYLQFKLLLEFWKF